MQSLAVHPAEIAVSPWPLTPGAPAEVRFAQRLKKGLALRELRAELKCKESATYGAGTDSRTDTSERLKTALPPVDLTGGGSRGRYEPRPAPNRPGGRSRRCGNWTCRPACRPR